MRRKIWVVKVLEVQKTVMHASLRYGDMPPPPNHLPQKSLGSKVCNHMADYLSMLI